MYSDAASSIVRLNIGGKKYCTTVDTLTHREPHSMLAAMFSGRHTVCSDSEGYVFVDRDGKHFRHVLNWLRDGVVLDLTGLECSELLLEAEYYQLLGLVDGITEVLNRKKDGEEKYTGLARTDILKRLKTEQDRLIGGVNLSDLDLSNLDLSYVDFSYSCLKNVFFSSTNLHRAKFRERCEFTRANLRGAVLDGANLHSANLQDACLMDCSFRDAELEFACLQNVDLTNANMEGANLQAASLKGTKLNNANLRGAYLQRTYVRDVNFQDTHLDGANAYLYQLDGHDLDYYP